MATGRKRIRANPVVVCPRCRGYLELQLQGEEYQHLQCIQCKTQVMIPLKMLESKLKEDKKYGRRNQ
jgi:uncharacterized protein YbaR (Trm112 family)